MEYLGLFFVLFIFVNTFISVITVFSDRNRDIAAIWAWLLVLILFPGMGLIIYLFVGRKISKDDIFNLREQAKVGLPEYLADQEVIIENQINFIDHLDFNQNPNKKYSLARMMLEVNQPPLTDDNIVDSFVDGEEKFAMLIEDIKKAEHHIHICYYIFRSDKLGTRIIDALVERAQAGVEVRLLYDPVGGRTFNKKFFEQLHAHGGQTEEAFGSRFSILNFRLNYRNHRKIAVIDGKIGYVGGFNVGDDYLGEYEAMGYWRDTHLRIKGSAVHQLQERFVIDWNASRKSDLITYNETYFPAIQSQGDKAVQIISSGPDSEDQAIKKGYLKMISIAKESIYIQTPYFIPDDAIKEALQIALLSGIDVKIMIPNKPDHPFVYQATLSYAEEMMKMGAEIYSYDIGFLHAKTMIIDGEIFTVGTANFDIRSFKLNFEVNAFIYDKELAHEHISYFEQDIEDSVLLTEIYFENMSLWTRFKQQFSRLLSPIL